MGEDLYVYGAGVRFISWRPLPLPVDFITARKQSLRRLCFHRCLSVQGGLCPVGLCLKELCPGEGGLCPGESLSRGSLSRGSLSKGVSVQGVSLFRGVSVQRRGLCPGGLCPQGPLSSGSLFKGSLSGVFCQGDPNTVTCGWYASYWNVFLFSEICFVDPSHSR